MIIKLVLCVVWLVLIPTVLGMLYGYGKPQEKNNSILLFLVGYCIAFAIFEILAIPMTFLQCKFTTLVSVYEIILLLLSIISIILNRKNLKIFFKTNIQTIKKMPLSTILVVVLILLQVIIVFRYMHVDDDDAFFVGNATTSIASNTISKINPSTGYGWGWQARY